MCAGANSPLLPKALRDMNPVAGERMPDEIASRFNVSRETIGRLQTYVSLLLHWQRQINLLTTASNGGQKSCGIIAGQNKQGVLRWFLQTFQQGVFCVHVHLFSKTHQNDFFAAFHTGLVHQIDHSADVVYHNFFGELFGLERFSSTSSSSFI